MSDNTRMESPLPLDVDSYIDTNLGPHTHRRRSETEGKPIHLPDQRKATHTMRTRLDEVFRGFTDANFDSVSWDSAQSMRDQYNSSLKTIPGDNPIIDTTKGIEFYLQVNTSRHPAAIKQEIENKHPEGSIPRSFLAIMSRYEQFFQVSPQESATLAMRYVTASLPFLKDEIARLKEEQFISDESAARLAFDRLLRDMPDHIAQLQEIQHSAPADKPLSVTKALAQLLLKRAQGKNSSSESSSIFLSHEDKDGLVEAYHIQDRPYTEEEVRLASRLLENNTTLGSSLIAFQQMFIDYSFMYLQMHPKRLEENLEPYNPIFIPIRDTEGKVVSLAPNPKLIKTMCNNWLPAIARRFMQETPDIPVDQIEITPLTSKHIGEGIRQAESYSIFSSIIGEFVQTDNPSLIEWKGSFPIACPAKNMFTKSGQELLPSIYDYLQTVHTEASELPKETTLIDLAEE